MVRRQLSDVWVGCVVSQVLVPVSGRFDGAAALDQQVVQAVSRRGKYLLVDGSRGVRVAVHLGMTGALSWSSSVPQDRFRAAWVGDRGVLALRDPRGFGAVRAIPREGLSGLALLDRLGPEPFDEEFSADRVRALSNGSMRSVKALLLDQELVAGVGNYVADEALFGAGVRPQAVGLSLGRSRRLRDAVRQVVSESIACGGMSMRDYVHLDGSRGDFASRLCVYGRAGSGCVRCGSLLRRATVAARTTVWCARCQR